MLFKLLLKKNRALSRCLLLILLLNSIGVLSISKDSIFSASGFSKEDLVEDFSPNNLVIEPYYRYFDIAVDEEEYIYLLVPGGIELYMDNKYPDYAGQFIGNDSYKQVIYSEDHLYLRTPRGFQIIHQITYNNWELSSNFVTNLSSDYYLLDIQYDNAIVYLFSYNSIDKKECMQIFDVSNKTHPTLNTTYFWSYSTVRNYEKFFFSEGYFYVAKEGYLDIFDLTNITLPQKVAAYHAIGGEWLNGLFVKGDYCYINRYGGSYAFFDVLDISNRSNPILISSFSKGDYYFPVIVIEDNYAYTACCEYVNVLDISQPDNVKLVSTFELRTQGQYQALKGHFFDAAFQNDKLHLIKNSYSDDYCYFVFDCSDPNNLEQDFPRGEIFFGNALNSLLIKYLLIGIGTSVLIFGVIITPYTIITRRKIKELKSDISSIKEE